MEDYPEPLAASCLHWWAGSLRPVTAVRKEAEVFCESSLRKGQAFAYVGSIQNLKDLYSHPLFLNSLSNLLFLV